MVLFGLVVSLWLMLVLFLVCLMGLLVVTLLSVLSGFVFVYFVGIWLFGLPMLVGVRVVWFRFRLLRRYLALWPSQVGRAYRLLEMVGEGCPGHGPILLLVC